MNRAPHYQLAIQKLIPELLLTIAKVDLKPELTIIRSKHTITPVLHPLNTVKNLIMGIWLIIISAATGKVAPEAIFRS
ncbi:hypothetical protein D3C73_898050 [compost metagenome]